MKIGLVIPSVPSYSETFFRNKIKGLEGHGHEVLLFTNNPTEESLEDTKIIVAPKLSGNPIKVGFVSVWNLFRAVLFHFNQSRRLYQMDKKDGLSFIGRVKNIISNKHILAEKVDWLHFGFGTMVLGRENVARAIGAKMAVSFRGFDIGIYPLKHPQCYTKLWGKVDKIHVISEDIKDLLYGQGYNGQSGVVKITPAIDTAHFKTETKNHPFKQIHFVTVARLHWKKGLEDTLQALALLKKESVDFRYTIIGEGEELERLRFAVHQLNLADQVIFLGKIKHEDVKKHLLEADVYIQYSIQEGFCNAVLEAQAMGLLCLVSDAEGLAENVLHDVTGWVVPKCSPNLLAQRIKKILDLSDNKKNEIRQKAIERVSTQFNLEKQQKEFVNFYTQDS